MIEKKINEPRILIYDDENMNYKVGYIGSIQEATPEAIEITSSGDISPRYILSRSHVFSCEIPSYQELDTIELDPTTMKRIAKYNKEIECLKLDADIKQKKEQIKELEDILNDRENRVKKLKDYIENIWNLDIQDDEDNDGDYDDYDW